MSANQDIEKFMQDFQKQREEAAEKSKKFLEEAYQKKENSLGQDIKDKTRYFRKLLLNNGFLEATKYIESRLWKWKYYKITSEDVAFIVDLETYPDYIEIYYGYTSTAFTKMSGSHNVLKEYGVDRDDIKIRNKVVYTYGEDEKNSWDKIKAFYDYYFNLSKIDILSLSKDRKKEFVNKINSKLKPLGFKKKGDVWSISLNDSYVLSFYASKSSFTDTFSFYYRINNVENKSQIFCCHENDIAYEYKNQLLTYNWQCYNSLEFNNFFDFIIKDILLPIINVDRLKFKNMLVELNNVNKPILFISTNEKIRSYGNVNCEESKCINCYRK